MGISVFWWLSLEVVAIIELNLLKLALIFISHDFSPSPIDY